MLINALVMAVLPLSAFADDSFLDSQEMAQLQPDPKVPGLKNYATPGKDLDAYSKVVVGNITLFYAKDSKAKDIDAKEMTEITNALHDALAGALERVVGAGRRAPDRDLQRVLGLIRPLVVDEGGVDTGQPLHDLSREL